MSTFLGINSIKPAAEVRGIKRMSADTYQGTSPDGSVTFMDFRDLGIDVYSYAKFIVRQYGVYYQSYDFLAKLVNEKYKVFGIEAFPWVVATGVQRVNTNFVRSTITADGVWDQVVIEMAGPGGNGDDWYSEGHTLIGKHNRQFTVKAIGKSPAGFQTLTLKPKDNVPNISVIPGFGCIYFPVGSFPGELGVTAAIGECHRKFVTRTYNHTEKEFAPMRKFESFKIERETMQNDIKAIDFWEMELGDGAGGTSRVYAFIDMQRVDQHFEFMNQMNAALFWEEPNLDQTAQEYRGGGLVPQIPKDFTRNLNPTQLTYKSFTETVTEWAMLNGSYLGDTIEICAGPLAYMRLQSILDLNIHAKVDYRTDPNMTMEAAKREYFIGKIFGGMYHALGYKLLIKNMREWATPFISGGSSLTSPNAGNRADDIIMLDPGPLMNVDPKTSKWKDEGVSKIQTFTNKQPNGALNQSVSVYKDGLIDKSGNNKSGPVVGFEPNVRFYDEMTQGIALVDERAAFYITPLST